MSTLFDPLTLAATAATIGAAVWVGHLADVARRGRRAPPVVQARAAQPPAVVLAPCGGNYDATPRVITTTHRPWVVMPEHLGPVAVLAQAEAGDHPTDATFAGLVLPLDGCGADAQVITEEPPQWP